MNKPNKQFKGVLDDLTTSQVKALDEACCGIRPDTMARFKRASAARRRIKEASATAPAVTSRVSDADRAAARLVEPFGFLEAQGFICKRQGRYYSAEDVHGDEHYRIDNRTGDWLWCDHHGNVGGDNISLVRDVLPGTGFVQAVRLLVGTAPVPALRVAERQESRPLDMPNCQRHDIDRAVAYLENVRKIGRPVIDAGFRSGFLRASPGFVLFCGYDSQERLRMYTRRAVSVDMRLQKGDARGSDKSFVPILPGDPAHVWVVEGGTDALALQDMRRKAGLALPAVIVSGGAGVRSWIERPHVVQILRAAEVVTVACDNEDTVETQIETDRAHGRQVERIKTVAPGATVTLHHPPDDFKDLANQNETMGVAK